MISDNKGFSLVEVMLSMLLLSVGLLGLMKLQSHLEQQAEQAKMTQEALYLAEATLEQLRTRSANGTGNTLHYSQIKTAAPTEDGAYRLTTTVQDVYKTQDVVNAKHINVRVSWLDRVGEQQSIDLETVLAAHSEFDDGGAASGDSAAGGAPSAELAEEKVPFGEFGKKVPFGEFGKKETSHGEADEEQDSFGEDDEEQDSFGKTDRKPWWQRLKW